MTGQSLFRGVKICFDTGKTFFEIVFFFEILTCFENSSPSCYFHDFVRGFIRCSSYAGSLGSLDSKKLQENSILDSFGLNPKIYKMHIFLKFSSYTGSLESLDSKKPGVKFPKPFFGLL